MPPSPEAQARQQIDTQPTAAGSAVQDCKTHNPSAAPTSFEWDAWLKDSEERLKSVYRLSPDRLISEYRHERETTRGYHGREILELLQNAGDGARLAGISGKVQIIVTPDGLVVGNTGCPFNQDGVKSLQIADLSPKRQDEAIVIGDKGLGFRSILNWTHSPMISSGKLGLAFLPDYAAGIVRKLEMEEEELARLVGKERSIAGGLLVPRLAFPQWIPDWPSHDWPNDNGLRSIVSECDALRSAGFDTAIGMPFNDPRAYEEARRQVDELKPEFLLLVDSIAQLEIRVEGRDPKVWSCVRAKERSIIKEGDKELSSWTVDTYNEEVPGVLLTDEGHRKRRFQMTLAIPDDGQTNPGHLYCYFPTEVGIPLPLLIHATVELDATRKHVNDTPVNRYILGEFLPKRIAELAEKQLGCEGANPWAGCRLVTPIVPTTWGNELLNFRVPCALKEAAKKKTLLPVLGGGYRSASQAKLPPGAEARWWPMRLFPEMVALEDEEEEKFTKYLEVGKLNPAEILSRLLATDRLTLEERAKAIVGLIRCGMELPDENLASLLCDDSEKPLQTGTNAMLQPVGELPTLPSWATIHFLHSGLRQQLADLLKTADNRELQQKLRPFGVAEYSLSALIRPVMAEANRLVRERPHDEPVIRGEALEFLRRVHRSEKNDVVFPSDATVKLLNQEGNWTDPKSLYLGEGYGTEGNVTQDLYARWAKDKLVAGPELLGLHTNENGENVCFLLWLGVKRWPREIEAQFPIDPQFQEAVKDSLPIPADFKDFRIKNRQELNRAWISNAKTIDGLVEILEHAPPEAILAWMIFDERMAGWSRPTREHGSLGIVPLGKQNMRIYSGPLPSYTQWKIANSPWLPSTGGTKEIPRRCLIGDRQLEVLLPSPTQPDPTLLERYSISERVNEAFQYAGVMFGLAQLGREDLYRLLLDVPERSRDGKAGRALCRWFVSNESHAFGSAGSYQERFFQQGKIWGSKDGVSDYYLVTQLRYVDQEGFPPALTAKLAIADLPKRVGSKKVEDILGIKPLERSEIQSKLILHTKSPEQDNRAAWFDEAKPFIKCLRQTQTKQEQAFRAFERLKLVVCDELHVQMQYENTSYDHTAQEGEWFVFSDHLYVRGDLDDPPDLLADAVGVAIASVFGMADGDAFAKILRCEHQSRSKLFKRMCGDDFHEEIETAKAKSTPAYAGPINPPTALKPSEAKPHVEERQTKESENNKPIAHDQETKPTSGVFPVVHVPKPPPEHRNLIVRNVQRVPSAPNGMQKIADGDRCEKMAVAFEEKNNPPRYALEVGHITGLDAPGVDLVSFDSEEDREKFRNPETRDTNKVRRFIEVKGRSSSEAKIQLKGNELKAAREHKDRYYLYRFYENKVADGQFHVSILQNPMSADEARTTIIEFDLDRAKETQRFTFITEAQ